VTVGKISPSDWEIYSPLEETTDVFLDDLRDIVVVEVEG
jgi:hypothetical protein